MTTRYDADGLTAFAKSLLEKLDLPSERAAVVADILEYFKRETGWLAAACLSAAGLPGESGVRLPGQRGLALQREYLANGVELAPTIMPLLEPWAEKLGVALPAAV